MTMPFSLNRREFVRMAGVAALLKQAASLPTVAAQSTRILPGYAFVGVMGVVHGVHVYAIQNERWSLRQVVLSNAPVSMALHPSRKTLYVLNGVNEYQGLPRGSVQTFSVHPGSGHLTLQGRQPLSLSATMPRQLTVSPDGKWLAIAVHGGGAYNLLPIAADGQAGRPCGILKETGCGPVPNLQDRAYPTAVLFDKTGHRIITADLGSDRVCVLSTEDGLATIERHEMTAGAGPRHLALHPSGDILFVANALEGSLSSYSYNAARGRIGTRLAHLLGGFGDALAMHPNGEFLLAAGNGEITTWRIESSNGDLSRMHSRKLADLGNSSELSAIAITPDGSEVMALTNQVIFRIQVDQACGHLGQPLVAESVVNARSIAILPASPNFA